MGEGLRQRLRRLAELRRRHGAGRTALRVGYRLAQRLTGLEVYRIRALDLDGITELPLERPGFAFRFLGLPEARRFAKDPANDLDPRFVERLSGERHLCFAALSGERLAAYTWYALDPVEAEHSAGVEVHFPPDTAYSYKMFTRPEFRGQQLHGRRKGPLIDALLAQGVRRRFQIIEATNYASLRTSSRGGARDLGALVILGFGRHRLVIPPRRAERAGIEFARRAS